MSNEFSLNYSDQVHPALGGIGYGSTVVAGLVGCYYNVIIAWCIFYLWSSMNVSGARFYKTKLKTVSGMTFSHCTDFLVTSSQSSVDAIANI